MFFHWNTGILILFLTLSVILGAIDAPCWVRSAFLNCLVKFGFPAFYPCNMSLKDRKHADCLSSCSGSYSLWLLAICLGFPFQETLRQAHLCPRLHQVKTLMINPEKIWLARTGEKGKLMPVLPRTVNWKYGKKFIWVTYFFFSFFKFIIHTCIYETHGDTVVLCCMLLDFWAKETKLAKWKEICKNISLRP